MKVSVIKQYSVFMPNRPGALARMTRLFADAGVNIVGISSEVRDDSALVRIAVDGPEDRSSVLSRAGFASVEGRLLSIELEDKPGQLARVVKLLADGGINVTNVYGTSLGRGPARLVFAVDNADAAAEVLRSKA